MVSSEPTLETGRRIPAWLIWLALAAAVIAAAFLMPWEQVWAALAHANKLWVFAALGICLAGAPIAATQWWLFLPRQYRLTWARVFEISALTVTARATLPFLGGDASSVGLMVMRGGMPAGAAVLVVTLDHFFTGLGKVAMVCAALAFASLPPFMAAAGASLAVVVACLFAVMLAAAVYGRSLHGLAGKFPARAGSWLRRIADLTDHLELMRHPARAAGATVMTALKKLIEISATLTVAHAVGIDLSLGNAILVVTALDLASVIPGPPAGLGVFEATALFIYHYLGVPPGIAFAAAVLQHAIYLSTDFGYGYAILIAETVRRRLSPRRNDQA